MGRKVMSAITSLLLCASIWGSCTYACKEDDKEQSLVKNKIVQTEVTQELRLPEVHISTKYAIIFFIINGLKRAPK